MSIFLDIEEKSHQGCLGCWGSAVGKLYLPHLELIYISAVFDIEETILTKAVVTFVDAGINQEGGCFCLIRH